MIDFKNFKIKRGPSDVLKNPLLIVEEGCWYLSTDTAELYVGIVENDTPVLKRVNGDIIPEINFEGYATEDFVREAIENIDIPEVKLYDDTELRSLINTKADITYVDEKVAGINIPEIPEVDLSNYYTKEETYNKAEVDALLPVKDLEEVKTTVQTIQTIVPTVEKIVPTVEKVEEILPKVEEEIVPTVEDLKTWVENKEYLQDVDLEGYAKKDHTHEQYLTKNEYNEIFLGDSTGNSTTIYPGCVKVYSSDSARLVLDTANNEFTINENNIATETKVLELIASNTVVTDNKIGIDFITDITIGHLAAGTEIKADMTISDILRRILCNPCDHEWIEATCTSPKTCKLCGITEGEVLGHIEEIIPGKAATCEETGLTEGKKCSRCEVTLLEQQIIPALGHEYASEVTLEPTCEEEGTRTYTCSNGCGETYTEVIPALGHNYVSEITKSATCTEIGIKTFTCTKCGDTYEEVIPTIDHKQAIKEENRVEPDCTNSGSYDTITYCTECGEELNRETTTIPALGHSMVIDEAKEPTCTETGLAEGSHCKRCDYKIEQEVIEALGHDYGEWIITKQPEVGVPGEQQKTCKRCGDVIIEEIPALEPEEPEVPEGVVGEIISKELPMYSIDHNGNVTTKDFEVITFNSREEADQAPVESCFYQVKDENGEIIESGYQDMQIANDGMYYIVALPKSVDYNSNMVRMQAYDDEEQLWVDYTKLPLTSDPETVANCCDEVGVDISHINTDLYTVWVNEDICTGSKLRYIIEE